MSMTSLAQVIDAIALKIERDRDAGPASLREWHAALLHHLTQPAQSVDVEKDAERYRWLRNKSLGQWSHPICVSQEKAYHGGMRYIGPLIQSELDAAIDAALQEKGNGD